MSLFDQYKEKIDAAVSALYSREFYAAYPEHPKAYGEEAPEIGIDGFQGSLGKPFERLLQTGSHGTVGEEISPYTSEPLGITYPKFDVEEMVTKGNAALKTWGNTNYKYRAAVLYDALERIKNKFFEIGYATMHTTGQSFMMSFQASGPHSNDRALEALVMGYEELGRFPSKTEWIKPMGKFNIELEKTYKPVPKGISLVIGCSTFPVWNTVPGVFASMITGNPVIVKPHPMAILPIAIVVAEIQEALKAGGFDINTIQLAPDSTKALITKDLAEHKSVKLIDYTGGSVFGNYVESLTSKTVFTEKAGVNSVIVDSVKDLKEVVQNLAFSVCLYSGQMCTAPQNFFIPKDGIKAADGQVSYDEFVAAFKGAIEGIVNHPKMGAGTLGAIQNPATLERTQSLNGNIGNLILDSAPVTNAEFEKSRTISPKVMEVDASNKESFEQELFGPIVLIIKTENTEHSLQLAGDLAEKHGALTCAAYTTNEKIEQKIYSEMENRFIPVSMNLTGFIWVNQHAAFSDFHGTGGNPAGNASFSNPEFLVKRFVWVGHRKVKA